MSDLRALVEELRGELHKLPLRHILSVKEVAERLLCGRTKVFDLLKDGTLDRARHRVGRRTGVTLASVEAYERGPSTALPERPEAKPIPSRWDEEAELAAVRALKESATPSKKRGRNGDVMERTKTDASGHLRESAPRKKQKSA